MFYLIYKITNNLNGKYYIGAHKTNNKDDGYMGSGKLIKRAIEKYGIENFTKEILVECNSVKEMFNAEKELVELNESSYNLKLGGDGGWDYNNTEEGQKLREFSYAIWRESGTKAYIEKFNNDANFKEFVLNHMKTISKMGTEAVLKKYPNGVWHNKTHSDETKQKMKQSAIGKHDGEKNSQFGSMWITNGTENKKIKKIDPIPDGWSKGRKIK